jgi:hypothetical protein
MTNLEKTDNRAGLVLIKEVTVGYSFGLAGMVKAGKSGQGTTA